MLDEYIVRTFDASKALSIQSEFLFGPRQSGKTSYIEHQLGNIALHIDLLDTRERTRYMRDPGLLADVVRALDNDGGIVVVDEIQHVPALLDEVHRMIAETRHRFLLTGSSARKLLKSGVNMLGGRAGMCIFHPFVWPEVKNLGFSLEHAFLTGMLPSIYLDEDNADHLLDSYCSTFLISEVQNEGYTRNLPAFSRFLEIAAVSSGEILNYSNIASDIGMSKNSVREWYSILSDMMIGNEVPVYQGTRKRKAIDKSKYYLFDVGVLRSLMNIPVPTENMSEYGKFFEHMVANELIAYLDYNGADFRNRGLYFWRTTGGIEVDFLFPGEVAIETKTTKEVDTRRDLKGLRALMEEEAAAKYILVSRDSIKRKTEDGIYLYPYEDFLDELWSGKLIKPRNPV